MPRRQLSLSETERRELVGLRDHAHQPYRRERAAALLKVADGIPAAAVARHGLLRPRRPDTVYEWLKRYQTTGCAGLAVRPGRGRKPAFSPGASPRNGGSPSAAAALSTGSAGRRTGAEPLDREGVAPSLPLAGRFDGSRGAEPLAARPPRLETGPGFEVQPRS